MSYQNLVYNINLLPRGMNTSGGTSKLHMYVEVPGTIRYLPAIKHKFIANKPTSQLTKMMFLFMYTAPQTVPLWEFFIFFFLISIDHFVASFGQKL